MTWEGLEPSTQWLRVICSTNWATKSFCFAIVTFQTTVCFSIAGAKIEVLFFPANFSTTFFHKILIKLVNIRGCSPLQRYQWDIFPYPYALLGKDVYPLSYRPVRDGYCPGWDGKARYSSNRYYNGSPRTPRPPYYSNARSARHPLFQESRICTETKHLLVIVRFQY